MKFLKRITWLHEVVYSNAGRPTFYEEMSDVLFINSYFMVMAGEAEAVRAIMMQNMEDSEAYE